MGIFCVLIVAFIMALGFGVGLFKTENSPEESPYTGLPTLAPTTRAQKEAVETFKEWLVTVSYASDDALGDLSSPESLAAQWVALEDPLSYDFTDDDAQPRILQRYALAALYFARTVPWDNERNWLSADECAWYGIDCVKPRIKDSPIVNSIDLSSNGLSGPLSPDIALLSSLATVSLNGNSLTGTLPASVSSLVELSSLLVASNELTGTIDHLELSALSNLKLLDMSSNAFSGSLPSSFYSLKGLEMAAMDDNAFNGTISPSISNLTSLTRLTIGRNKFSGALPTTLGLLPDLGKLVHDVFTRSN
jgi:Leucine-rich repeat (LRR) protein